MNKKQKKVLVRILLSTCLLIAASLVSVDDQLVRLALYLVPYLIIGYDILLKALKGVRNRQPFDECFLMAVATVGAFALDEYQEAAAVMLFYQTGELFQSYAVGKSRRSIAELMDIRPDHANIQGESGELEEVDPDEVAVGDIIVVRPGERVPIDGIVTEGQSAVDTAALTGESVPRTVRPGDEVLSGSVLMDGMLKLRTVREFGESTASRVLDMVENASSRKSRSEAFITRFARVYTPAVCLSALALALVPPVVLLLLGREPRFTDWVYRALTFLVISCPCALVISIPLSFFAGIGTASRQGVLVKGSNYLEALSGVRIVAFDKTGTMTQGVFQVVGVHRNVLSEAETLRLAAIAESRSTHPIARSIREACPAEVDLSGLTDVTEVSGRGVRAVIDGTVVLAGSEMMMLEAGIECGDCSEVGTVVHLAQDGRYLGHILISDVLKPGARDAVTALRAAGVRKTVMLTGDRDESARAVFEQLTADEYRAELMPDQKVAEVERLLNELKAGEKLAFVGDGINDAPVLSRADVGIAMGGLGSDAAIEAADVVLMDDDPVRLPLAVRIARRTRSIAWQNIVFALGVKVIIMLLGVLGIANMWLAVFADVGVSVIAVLNATRAMRLK